MSKIESIVAELSKLTVLEAAELAKALEDHWGVSAAAPVAIAAAAAPVAPALTGSTSFGFLEGSGVSASPDFGGDGFLLNGFLNGAEVFWNMVYSVLAMIL